MGSLEIGSRDLATRRAVASITAANQSTEAVEMPGPFLIMATGGVGTFALEFSVDGGTNWFNAQLPNGSNNSWTAPFNQVVLNPNREAGILYRLTCTAFTSGPITARISGGGMP
ncbi:MAG: hypothetical protein ING28_03390 [Roseomonas sp.]|nr:hypothetical protein [Roseomonas sp.]